LQIILTVPAGLEMETAANPIDLRSEKMNRSSILNVGAALRASPTAKLSYRFKLLVGAHIYSLADIGSYK
jgi:hypothetical protein